MAVPERLVAVPVGMRFGHRAVMAVLVVFVMHMGVVVFESFVIVHMLMAFREMQTKSHGHEQTGADELHG